MFQFFALIAAFLVLHDLRIQQVYPVLKVGHDAFGQLRQPGLRRFNSCSIISMPAIVTNLRFSWLQSANAGLYLVYNEIDDDSLGAPDERQREFILKFSYIFDVL